jgi:CheY-like chemotaxis protein
LVDAEPSAANRIVGSAPALLQVLTNLLLNAIALSPEGSEVRVDLASSGGEAQMAVVDEGPGIDAERRATLFGSGVSTRAGGAGIGLTHAHSLSATKGGSLSLGNSSRGARFEITWPLVPSRSSMRPSARPPSPLGGIRVLLLEDDDAVVGLLSTALTLRGAEVTCARTEAELELAAQNGSFDAALLDLSPIAGNLREAVRWVRVRSATAKVVIISGSALDIGDDELRGATAWVRKPFEVGEILDALGDLPKRAPGQR